MNKKENGFTLVELLAVIIILVIILVIVVPQIMDAVTESRKRILVSNAKLIASSAENMKMSNDTLGIYEKIACEDVSELTDGDYESCNIKFDSNGEAKVTIIGKGRFEGLVICKATSEDAVVTNGNSCPIPILEKIESLATESNTEGLETTSEGNIRYTGGSPKNYIKFNEEDWRIIGIFNVTTAEGKEEKLVKIVSNSSIGGYSWDSSEGNNDDSHEEGEVNDGYGINQWGEVKDEDENIIYEGADLMRELNTLYLNQESGTCYNGPNNASNACDFSATSAVKGINGIYRNMIENVVWNTGTFIWGSSAQDAYNAERETKTGKTCTSGAGCTDEVTRTTSWTGKIGLIYPSDYGFASTNSSCRNNINDTTSYSCKNDNWLQGDTTYWTISPRANLNFSSGVYRIDYSGFVGNGNARVANDVKPSVYLKSNASITSGDGTEQNPYQLS